MPLSDHMEHGGTIMEYWQQRVVEEKQELDEKLNKLNRFIDDGGRGGTFAGLPEQDRALLRSQAHAMQLYSHVLGQRIDRFDVIPTNTIVTSDEAPTSEDEG